MSMYWAGYSGIALVLDQDEFEGFKLEYAKRNCIFTETLEEDIEYDGPLQGYPFNPSMRSLVRNPFYMVPVSPDYTSGADLMTFIPDGSDEDRYNDLNNMELYAVFAKNQLYDIESLTNPLYNTYDELVNEFRDLMEDYLPEDFDWDSHIGVLHYAAFA